MATPERRANVAWWQANGGAAWLQEVERRRTVQPRYGIQERWLLEHFRSTPPLRVLDFGCGYGRHLKNLRELPHLTLYGCDMSPTMFEAIGAYVGDPSWARERTRLIEPLGRVPFEDRFFDVTYTSEVLIHVHPDDLPAVLSELARVTLQRLVLIENKRTNETRLGTAAHDGCWLHDIVAVLRDLGIANVRVLEDVLADQDVYLVDVLRGASSPEWARVGEALASRDAAVSAAMERQGLLRSELAEATRDRIVADAGRVQAETLLALAGSELDRLSDRLDLLESSVARRAIRRAKRFVRARPALNRAYNVTRAALGHEPVNYNPLPQPHANDLQFAGIARAGLPASPEAFLAARPRVVAICHPDWRGIRAATRSLTEAVLEIPAIRDEAHAARIGNFLAESGAQVVVIQGVPPGSQRLAVALRRRWPTLRLLNVFHGSSAQHSTSPDEAALLDDMLELARHGVLDGVGLVKAGMAEALRRCGFPTYALANKVRRIEPAPKPRELDRDDVHVGVFVPDLWVKNQNTQVLAALTLPRTTVHVTETPPAKYLHRFDDRVVVEGMLEHEEFVKRVGEMDANLYVSLSECYPMTVLESLERGVPCLTSHTSNLFDDEPFLFERLVVTRHDDAWAIATKLDAALGERTEIVARGHAHLAFLNARADELWRAFTNG